MAQAAEAQQAAVGHQPPPLRLSRVLHARRETVFKAWSSGDHVKRWFAPDTFDVPDAKVEMHVGGVFDVCMRAPTGEEHWIRGRFVEVTPHTRLAIDMHVDMRAEVGRQPDLPVERHPSRHTVAESVVDVQRGVLLAGRACDRLIGGNRVRGYGIA